MYDKIFGPGVVVMMLIVMALVEWIRYFVPSPPSPWLYSAIAVAALAYMIWQARKVWPRIMALKLAEEGEKAVGQFLEGLRELGYQVFHDVIGQDFNIDHVIIGPGGVFTIETKTWKKPRRGSPQIEFDGETLTVNGLTPDRNPVVQARAQANWVGGLLAESTGRKFAVRPVILFPGWFIAAGRESRRDVWVLEPKALPAFLEKEKSQMALDDVKLAAFHLSRFVREQERALEASK